MSEEIYNCPEPWKSKFKIHTRKELLIIGLILIAIGTFLTLLFLFEYFYLILSIVLIIFLIGFYLVFAYVYVSYNKKDDWKMELPPNETLFDNLNSEIEKMLKSSKYNYKKVHETTAYQKGGFAIKRHPGIMDFVIKIKNAPNFIINTELKSTAGGPDNYATTISELKIINVQENNLLQVRNILNELTIILNNLNYQSYFNK